MTKNVKKKGYKSPKNKPGTGATGNDSGVSDLPTNQQSTV